MHRSPAGVLKALINPQGGDYNCRACAVAVDHVLRDGTVSVAPGNLGAGSASTIERLYGRTFKASTVSGIVKDMQMAGDGARGIVLGARGRNSHVFNVVNIKGDVIFLGGQQGQAKLNWRHYSLLRTD
ncbi:toxin glutamine deamidase domain-containing protein [Streptomyces sp. NPDC102437]|uniref:toxin glutamine deamidase domain-containing protein n=1 Tax=Streptomyces sp. NPDC102437 TaxID=3366175 RepID=UPI0038150D1A